jgi:hypothetical protein
VQVAVAMIVLIAFTAFVADYGLMWVSRRQAQNAADAGALAGAIALAYDDFADRSNTGPAKESAHNVAVANYVAGEAPKVDIDADVYFYDDDPAKFPDECIDDTCIRVDVYRNQEANNPLPVWFGQLVGLVDQGVRATAIARASFGNASDCLKPWAVIDRWDEHWDDGMPTTDPWDLEDTFDKYMKSGDPDPDITAPDVYRPPTVGTDGEGNPDWDTYDPGSGFHPFEFDSGEWEYTSDYGRQLSLKMGDQGDWNFGAGWFMRLNLAPFDTDEDGESCTSNGAKCYREHIKGCVGVTWAIGDELMIDNNPGNAVGPTENAVGGPDDKNQDEDSLYNQDPDAYWDDPDGDLGPLPGKVMNCDDPCPRVVAIPLVNPDALMEAFKNGRNTVPIANIAGFFVEGVFGNGSDQAVVGRLVTMPGLMTSGTSGMAPSTFMVNISLIR